MLSSSKIQPIIPLFFFISLQNSHIRAENDFDYPLEIPSLLTTSEIAEEIMNQNLNSNCTNLRAFFNSETFQEVENILNMTVDSTEVNENREEYHSRIKRCSEVERQNRIVQEFERRNKKKELSENQKSGRSHLRQKNPISTNILGTTIKDTINQDNHDQDLNSDDVLRGDLARAMTEATSIESYSRTYRTLPSSSKQFTDPLPGISTEKNIHFNDQVKKKSKMSKENQNNVKAHSQKITHRLSHDSKSTAKSLENGDNTKKGPLKSLFEKIQFVMQGGDLKNTADTSDLDSKQKSSSNDDISEEDLAEYEPVTSHKFFKNVDHITVPNQRSGNERDGATRALSSSSGANSEIIRGMHEETKKELQAKIEDLIQLRKKLLKIVRMANSAKNQTKISIPTIKNTKKVKETVEEILPTENFKSGSHSKTTHQGDEIDVRSGTNSRSKFGVNLPTKNVASLTPKSVIKVNNLRTPSNEFQKHPPVSFSSPNFKNSTIKAIFKNPPHEKTASSVLKTQASSNQIEQLDHHTTQFPSSERPPSKHHFPNHDQHLKIHLPDVDSSQNREHEDISARSQGIKMKNKDGRINSDLEKDPQQENEPIQKTVTTLTTKLKIHSLKTIPSAQDSAMKKLHPYTEQISNEKKSPALKDTTKRFTIGDRATETSSSTIKKSEDVQIGEEPALGKSTTLGIEIPTKKDIGILPREKVEIETENETQLTKENKNIPKTMAKHQKMTTQHSTTLGLPYMESEHLPETTSKITESRQISTTQVFHPRDVSSGPTTSQILRLRENEPQVPPQTSSTLHLNKITTLLYNEFSNEPSLAKHSNASTILQALDNAPSEPPNSASESSYFKKVTTPHNPHQSPHLSKAVETVLKSMTTLEPSHSRNITIPASPHHHETPSKATSTLKSAHSSEVSTTQSIIHSQKVSTTLENLSTNKITSTHSPLMKKSTILQHEEFVQGSTTPLNRDFTKTTTNQLTPSVESEMSFKEPVTTEGQQLDRNLISRSNYDDEVFSEVVGKSQTSTTNEPHRVHHPAMILKPAILPLLEKFKQHRLIDKFEKMRKNIKSRKEKSDKMSTVQPLHLHEDISYKSISPHESRSDSNIPLTLYQHSHHSPHSSEVSTLHVEPFHKFDESAMESISSYNLNAKGTLASHSGHQHLPSHYLDKTSTIQPFHSIEKSLDEVIIPSKLHTENHIVPHPGHHHMESPHADKFSTYQPALSIGKSMNGIISPTKLDAENHVNPQPVHRHIELPYLDKIFTLQPSHSIEKSMSGIPTKHTENHVIPQPVHYHIESPHLDKLSTLQPPHSVEKFMNGVILPSRPHTENHIPQPVHRHIESPHLDKLFTVQPPHSREKSMNGVTSPTKPHIENHIISHPVHHHIESLHPDKISTFQPSYSIEKSTSLVILPLKPSAENHINPQPVHHHIESPYLDKHSTIQPPHLIEESMNGKENHDVIPQQVHHPHIESPHQGKFPALQPSHSEASYDESKPNSHLFHQHSHFKSLNEISTPQSPHQIEKSAKEVTLPTKSHTGSYLIPQPVHHHSELMNFEKTSTHQPSHPVETFLKDITWPATFHEENVPNSHSIHSHLKHLNEHSTPQSSQLCEESSKGSTLPIKSHLGSHSILQPLPHHHNQHSESSSTLQPFHPTEMSLNKITLPEKPEKESHLIPQQFHHHPELTHSEKSSAQPHSTPTPIHLLINQAKTPHQNNTWTILKEMENLEKMKIEEIKNLQKKYVEAVQKLQQNNLSPTTVSYSDWFHKQQSTKTRVTDGTSSHFHRSDEHDAPGRSASEQDIKIHHHKSHEYDAQSHSASEQDIKVHHNLETTKPYLTDPSTSTTLQDDEILEKIPLPLPPLNPNDNWKYVTKLDRYYEKQKKITTPKSPIIIRPPSVNPSPQPPPRITPRPLVISASTIAPITVPPRMRPLQPSRNATVPKRPSTSTAASPTQKPPPPVNYNINSTINRNYNITINLVTPDSAPRENSEGDEDEPENNEPSTMDEPNPFTNLARPTDPTKIENKEEPARDFDSSPHPSLPRQLPSQSYNSSNLSAVNETSLPSSTIPIQSNQPTSFLRTEIDPNEKPLPVSSTFENKDAILQTPIPTVSKSSGSLTSGATTPYQEIINNLKSITMRVQSRTHFELADHSTTQPSTYFTSDNKTDSALTHTPCPNVNFTQSACNNIIIIPNKTEEILEILRLLNMVNLNDQASSTPLPSIFSNPKSAPSDSEPHSNPFSDIKSLLTSIQKSKLTPSENTELRKSIGDLLAALKQRRSNEYTRLYLSKVNPMVGDGRDSIQAITQINEYIELLELMLVYLARDPDKLLDESKDARFDNFESPYPQDDPQRRLIEDQFYYVHPKILNEFIDVYKKYSKDRTYYGKPIWQFNQENGSPRRASKQKSFGSSLSNLFHLKDLIGALTYDRGPMYRPGIQYADYQN